MQLSIDKIHSFAGKIQGGQSAVTASFQGKLGTGRQVEGRHWLAEGQENMKDPCSHSKYVKGHFSQSYF